MQNFLEFIQTHKIYVDAAHALSSVINILGWCLGTVLLISAWRRNAIRSMSVGPFNFQMQEAAVEATATAVRDWQAITPSQKVDVPRIRETVRRAFAPNTADKLIGKTILWVDDNPTNNNSAVRALRKLQLNVEQATNTEQGLAAMKQRHFDLVISDMGRGTDMRAGYGLLSAIRSQGIDVPFLIFASGDTTEFRQEAAQRGAQLSTNDMMELMDTIIKLLAE